MRKANARAASTPAAKDDIGVAAGTLTTDLGGDADIYQTDILPKGKRR